MTHQRLRIGHSGNRIAAVGTCLGLALAGCSSSGGGSSTSSGSTSSVVAVTFPTKPYGPVPAKDAEIAKLFDSAGAPATLTVATSMETGSTYVTKVQEASKTCVSQGKKPIVIKQFPQQANVDLALLNGRVDVEVTDQLIGLYQTGQHPGRLKIQAAYDMNPNGLCLLKGSKLTKPIQAALQKLMSNGTYAKMMSYWHAEGAKVPAASVNG